MSKMMHLVDVRRTRGQVFAALSKTACGKLICTEPGIITTVLIELVTCPHCKKTDIYKEYIAKKMAQRMLKSSPNENSDGYLSGSVFIDEWPWMGNKDE